MDINIDDHGFFDNGEVFFNIADIQAIHKAGGPNGELMIVFVLTGNNLVIKFSDEEERSLVYNALKAYKMAPYIAAKAA